jgi:UDP-N-acetylmuramoyl-L-alanyl-D-glutamate--2,6-diaminopimelate ligase
LSKLEKILKGLNILKSVGNIALDVASVQFDSRKVMKGDVFVAVKGTLADGHLFIPMAVEKGAIAVVCESFPAEIPQGVTFIKVQNSETALGIIASNYYGNPSSKLKLVGITGTNGKTTTVTLLYRLFQGLGHKSGLLSTVVNFVDDEEVPSTHTTPDQLELNDLLSRMVTKGCEYCFMEVSSHSIVQGRISGLIFAGGIFSNITHDHLDYHKTFDAYLKAKKAFFDGLPETAFALVNTDDKNGKVMLQNTRAVKHTYALKNVSDFKCKILESHFSGMHLLIDDVEVWSQFIGQFNAYNLLAVYASSILLGMEKNEVLRILSGLQSVNGRFETIHSASGIVAIVDYAHTPDALENVLSTINAIRSGKEKVITVVGAGGNRDKTKRPEMAKIAATLSDKVILTSDNPRFEDPNEILFDMQSGLDETLKMKVITIVDRLEAIKTACMLANQNDIILLAGKGHETYQEVKGVKHHFDDKETIHDLFKNY